MTTKTPRESRPVDAEEYLCQRCQRQFLYYPGTALECSFCGTNEPDFLVGLYQLDVDLAEELPRSDPEEPVT